MLSGLEGDANEVDLFESDKLRNGDSKFPNGPSYGAGFNGPSYGAGLNCPSYGAGLNSPSYGAGFNGPS